jgi:hypothetical protein
MPVVPPTPRFKVETLDSSAARITIPSRKNLSAIFFSCMILIPWGSVEWGTLRIIIGGVRSTITQIGSLSGLLGDLALGWAILIFWWCLWTVAGILPLYPLFWNLVGKEVIDINPNSLIVARKIFSFSRPKEYDSTHIKDLRISQPVYSSRFLWGGPSIFSIFWGIGEGIIAFDYGAKTYRFGSGLDEAEAKMIVFEITTRYPQYAPK